MNLTITVGVCKHRCCLFRKPVQLEFDIARTPYTLLRKCWAPRCAAGQTVLNVHFTLRTVQSADRCHFTLRTVQSADRCLPLHITYRSVSGSLSATSHYVPFSQRIAVCHFTLGTFQSADRCLPLHIAYRSVSGSLSATSHYVPFSQRIAVCHRCCLHTPFLITRSV